MRDNSKEKITPIHNSLQMWYEGDTDNVKLEVDVNLWRLKGQLKRKVYLDFGLKIIEPEKVKKIFIYFPFKIEKNQILDLGRELINVSLLNGIFNESYVINTKAKNIFVKEESNTKIVFSIYQLDVDKDIYLKNNFSGTVMSFIVKGKDYPRYYRFRIATDNYGTLFEKYKPRNSFFDSAFIETEIIDFRINEKRNQDIGLIEVIEENKKFQIEAINFFVMSPIQDEVESDGINLIYKRQLEMGNFWRTYLECGYKRMSVYKCKTTSGMTKIEDFNCFCKIKYRKSNIGTIIIYLLVLCGLSVMFNVLSNAIWLFLTAA